VSKRTILLLAIGAIATLVVGWQVIAFAGPVGNASGFEDDDGNLVDDIPLFNPNTGAGNIDWNNFNPTTWTGTPPNRTSNKTFNGWKFTGLEDAQAINTDNGFAGGTKQDQDCPSVVGAKAPNKDDLRRIYLSTKNVGGNTFLNLAWVRIPQNTTSSSAHVAFEFNKGNPNLPASQCGAGSGGLVKRTAGDMLIVYDFEGGGNTPVLTLRRWVTSGACEISSNSPPCWGTATNLTAGGFAEARVNTTGSVLDAIGPTGNQTLGNSEFGEAGINLTAAGVFTPGACESFGNAYAVSRSSGNSGTAQMKDLVGPGAFTLGNCATVITRKVTSPSGDTTTNFGYTTNVTTNPATTTSPFSLKDGGSKTITSVVTGSNKTVTEDNPGPNYQLTSINCDASTVPAANRSTDTTARAVTFSIAAGETLDCTFTNTKQQGHIVVDKVTDPSGDTQSFDFTLEGGPSNLAQQFSLTDAADPHDSGAILPGSGYDASETVPPDWELSSVSCDSGESNEHNITVEPGETVTCTFNNSKQTTSIATEQSFIPQDKATITGTGSGTFDGTVDFRLYTGSTCDAGGGTLLYEDLDNALDGNNTASTDNDGTESAPGALDGYTINGTGGTFSWKVTYEGDPNHPDETSCVEESNLTIDNDNTP
jgi:hypothetical protein